MEKEKFKTITKLEISFNESLSNSSIALIKRVLKESLGFKTEITEVE